MNWRSDNSGFFAGADKVGTFLFANFIWAVLAMTIIGIPFATVGLFAMMNAWIQGRQPEFYAVFVGAIREHWRKALIIGLIDFAIGGLLYVNYSIFQIMEMDNAIAVVSSTMTFCVAILLFVTNLYLWSLVSLLDLTLKNLIKLSLLLVLTYPMRSAWIAILAIIALASSLFLPIAFFLFLTFSTIAYIGARGTWWVLPRYFSHDDLKQLLLS